MPTCRGGTKTRDHEGWRRILQDVTAPNLTASGPAIAVLADAFPSVLYAARG
jgi:hypothetical protein